MHCCVITFIYGINELVRKIFALSPVNDALVPFSFAVVYTAETCQFVDFEIACVVFIVNLIFLSNFIHKNKIISNFFGSLLHVE